MIKLKFFNLNILFNKNIFQICLLSTYLSGAFLRGIGILN